MFPKRLWRRCNTTFRSKTKAAINIWVAKGALNLWIIQCSPRRPLHLVRSGCRGSPHRALDSQTFLWKLSHWVALTHPSSVFKEAVPYLQLLTTNTMSTSRASLLGVLYSLFIFTNAFIVLIAHFQYVVAHNMEHPELQEATPGSILDMTSIISNFYII